MEFPVFLQTPHYQAIFFIGLTVLLFVLKRQNQEENIWMLAGVIYVLFILVNALTLFWLANSWSYFFYSMLVSVAYLFLIEKICNAFISMYKTEGSGEGSMIFLVIIYHPIALLLVMLVKWLF